jgi:hypothetical protein
MFALKKKFPGNRLSILQHPVWGSCHVTFHSYLTVQSYARLLNILTNQTAALKPLIGENVALLICKSSTPRLTARANLSLTTFSTFLKIEIF